MKNRKIWFTLIEILVVICIISILAIWFSQVNYNNISDKQIGNIFTNKIVSILETVRNNSLLWKGRWSSLKIPLSWKIEIPYSSWSIITSYENSAWSYIVDNELGFTLKTQEKISKITCKYFWTWATSKYITSTGTIIFEKEKIKILWCDNPEDPNYKILQIRTMYKNFGRTITINTINGVIETSTN